MVSYTEILKLLKNTDSLKRSVVGRMRARKAYTDTLKSGNPGTTAVKTRGYFFHTENGKLVYFFRTVGNESGLTVWKIYTTGYQKPYRDCVENLPSIYKVYHTLPGFLVSVFRFPGQQIQGITVEGAREVSRMLED